MYYRPQIQSRCISRCIWLSRALHGKNVTEISCVEYYSVSQTFLIMFWWTKLLYAEYLGFIDEYPSCWFPGSHVSHQSEHPQAWYCVMCLCRIRQHVVFLQSENLTTCGEPNPKNDSKFEYIFYNIQHMLRLQLTHDLIITNITMTS